MGHSTGTHSERAPTSQTLVATGDHFPMHSVLHGLGNLLVQTKVLSCALITRTDGRFGEAIRLHTWQNRVQTHGFHTPNGVFTNLAWIGTTCRTITHAQL